MVGFTPPLFAGDLLVWVHRGGGEPFFTYCDAIFCRTYNFGGFFCGGCFIFNAFCDLLQKSIQLLIVHVFAHFYLLPGAGPLFSSAACFLFMSILYTYDSIFSIGKCSKHYDSILCNVYIYDSIQKGYTIIGVIMWL